MGPEFAAGAVLGGALLVLVAVGIGYGLRGGWLRAAELERDSAQRERDQALAALAAERQAHEAYARRAHSVDAEAARRARLAADPGLGDLEFARRLLLPASAPAAPAPADPPAGGPAVGA